MGVPAEAEVPATSPEGVHLQCPYGCHHSVSRHVHVHQTPGTCHIYDILLPPILLAICSNPLIFIIHYITVYI